MTTQRVLWHVTMSLDGFIAGPRHEMDWMPDNEAENPVVPAVIASVGAVLCGRNTWDLVEGPRERDGAGAVYGGQFDGPVFVMTHRPEPGGPYLSGDLKTAVGTALAAAGGRDLLLIGAGLARTCVAAGLVDRLVVHVAPILLGEGVRLYEAVDRAPLRLVEESRAGQYVNLEYNF
ncbi:dihydrofolate reductase family protein [Dactylosporangium sp. AC04546]|uniref:dihydrofolate reductase family protein n=1 Tax=Dactylosporangium sp. AC04546 TaxID=2862460 RepID=UPI001EDF6156|nr:dihydrofolate reductase family protein [Dactylosporangium sp. AC04546]WVK83299.1 dihydrofolate reductase family protein [Dactylosporangium sp. AC04546]